MNKKYEFTEETIRIGYSVLHRIRSLMNFGNVHIGDIGGFIEKEENLSHDGNAWVFYNARVSGDARVFDNAWVLGNARVFGNARLRDNARVSGNSLVFDNAAVYGNAFIYGNARVYGNAWVYKNAHVYDNAFVLGRARVSSNAKVFNSSIIDGISHVGKNAIIGSTNDIYSIAKIESNSEGTTFYKTKDSIYVSCRCFNRSGCFNVDCFSCFNDSIEEFEKRVKDVHQDTMKQYLDSIKFAKTLLTMDK